MELSPLNKVIEAAERLRLKLGVFGTWLGFYCFMAGQSFCMAVLSLVSGDVLGLVLNLVGLYWWHVWAQRIWTALDSMEPK